MLTFRVPSISQSRHSPLPLPARTSTHTAHIPRVFPLIKSLNRVGKNLPPRRHRHLKSTVRHIYIYIYTRVHTNNTRTHARAYMGGRSGGGGGVARMNAQKLIKDRVVCPAGAWYPGDLTARPPILRPSSMPPPSSPPTPTGHTSFFYIYIYISVSDDVSTACAREQKRKHRRAVGLIDRPLFLPGRPQKLKTTIYQRNLQCTSACVCERENCRAGRWFFRNFRTNARL